MNWQAGGEVALKILTAEPGPPKDLTATGGEQSATLGWTAPEDPAGDPVTGYRYRVRPPQAVRPPDRAWGEWVDVPGGAGATTHRVEDLLFGGTYAFGLRAVSGAGPGRVAEAEADIEPPAPPALRSEAPCGGAIWCATVVVGGYDLMDATVTGYRGVQQTTGSAAPVGFRYLGVDYAVSHLHHEAAPGETGGTLFFATDPALPTGEEEFTLDVGGRRLLLREARRNEVPAAGGSGKPYAWRVDGAPVVNWAYGDTALVRLFAPRALAHGSPLRPAGMDTGDRFRLLFVTARLGNEAVDGESYDVEAYNRIVRRRARAGSHRDNPIAPFADGFAALASTPFVDARTNAGTRIRTSSGYIRYYGVPIYWLNGDMDDRDGVKRKVADDYEDLHDASWDEETRPKDEWGDDLRLNPPCATVFVSTGSLRDGRVDAHAPFGARRIRAGALNAEPDGAAGPVATGAKLGIDYCDRFDCGGDLAFHDDPEIVERLPTPIVTVPQWEDQRLYGLSPVFEIRATAPSVWRVSATRDRETEIELTWKLKGNGSDLTGLKIQRRRRAGDAWADAATGLDTTSRSHLFDGLLQASAQHYRVVAENALGAVRSKAVVGSNRGAPKPAFASARATQNETAQITIHWSLDNITAYPLTALTIEQCATSGTCQRAATPALTATSHAITGLGDGVVRLYRVVATNAVATVRSKTLWGETAGSGSNAPVPLTAAFAANSVPGRHGGADTTFTARIQFNQDADIEGLCAALTVTDGTCGSSAKVGDDTSFWEVAIAPDASKPVTVALPATTDCDAASAVCTADDTPLSSDISVTVSPPLLESAWESLPETHAGGGTTFTAQVRFSEDVDIADLCAAFAVTDGTCESSSKVGGDAALWEIVVAPAGAVCTAPDEPLSYGVFAVVARRALTVSLVSIPGDHGGVDTNFTVELRFSEDVDVDVDDLCESVSLLDATCGSSARDAGDANLWEVVVAPDGTADMWFILPANDCGHDEAVCTADGEPLSAGIYELVPRRPFTAAWVEESVPTAHQGAGTEFTVRVRFSEDAHVSYAALRDEALEVTNGTCTRFARLDGRNDLREATIEPDGTADVTLVLDSPTDCDADDAVCTKDDSPLVTVLELSVPGQGS